MGIKGSIIEGRSIPIVYGMFIGERVIWILCLINVPLLVKHSFFLLSEYDGVYMSYFYFLDCFFIVIIKIFI